MLPPIKNESNDPSPPVLRQRWTHPRDTSGLGVRPESPTYTVASAAVAPPRIRWPDRAARSEVPGSRLGTSSRTFRLSRIIDRPSHVTQDGIQTARQPVDPT